MEKRDILNSVITNFSNISLRVSHSLVVFYSSSRTKSLPKPGEWTSASTDSNSYSAQRTFEMSERVSREFSPAKVTHLLLSKSFLGSASVTG